MSQSTRTKQPKHTSTPTYLLAQAVCDGSLRRVEVRRVVGDGHRELSREDNKGFRGQGLEFKDWGLKLDVRWWVCDGC
jgi:hypothetical protein